MISTYYKADRKDTLFKQRGKSPELMFISFVLCYVLFVEGDNLSSLVRARSSPPHSVRTVVKSLIQKANQFLFSVPLLKNATIFFISFSIQINTEKEFFSTFGVILSITHLGEVRMVQWCENNSPPLMWRRGHMQVVGSLSCSEWLFFRYSSFCLSSKTNFFKFQFDLEHTVTLVETST